MSESAIREPKGNDKGYFSDKNKDPVARQLDSSLEM